MYFSVDTENIVLLHHHYPGPTAYFTAFASNKVKIHSTATARVSELYDKHLGKDLLTPPIRKTVRGMFSVVVIVQYDWCAVSNAIIYNIVAVIVCAGHAL